MKPTEEQINKALNTLKKAGYVLPYTMLWSFEDGKRYFDITDKQAYELVLSVLENNDYLMEIINEAIRDVGIDVYG